MNCAQAMERLTCQWQSYAKFHIKSHKSGQIYPINFCVSEFVSIFAPVLSRMALNLPSGGLHLKSSCCILKPFDKMTSRVRITSLPSRITIISSIEDWLTRPLMPRVRSEKEMEESILKTIWVACLDAYEERYLLHPLSVWNLPCTLEYIQACS